MKKGKWNLNSIEFFITQVELIRSIVGTWEMIKSGLGGVFLGFVLVQKHGLFKSYDSPQNHTHSFRNPPINRRKWKTKERGTNSFQAGFPQRITVAGSHWFCSLRPLRPLQAQKWNISLPTWGRFRPPPAPALSILTHRAPVALDLLKPPQLCKLGQLACPPTQPRPGGRLCKQVTGKAFPHGQTLGLAH